MTGGPHAVPPAVTAARVRVGALAEDVVTIDLGNQIVLTGDFLSCSTANDRTDRAAVAAIMGQLRGEGRCQLLGDELVAHAQQTDERFRPARERLRRDRALVVVPDEVRATRVAQP